MPQPTGVFISYRRTDSQATVGRLSDDLKRAFGDETIFRDIDDIAPGSNFVDALADALGACVVLLAVIGPVWLEQLLRRADNDDGSVDYVRREIETALSNGIRVIPVLVDGAVVPEGQHLPPTLQELARLQGHPQNDKSWRYDLGLLLQQLEKLVGRRAEDPFKRRSASLRALRQLPRKPVARRAAALVATVGIAASLTVVGTQWSWPVTVEEGDVAFLLPPEQQDADTEDALKVFNDIQSTLNLALHNPEIQLVPESVGAEDFDRYRFDRKQTLLDYRTPRGPARVFIRTAYGVDRQTGTRRMLVTPFLRPADKSTRWKMAEGWPNEAFKGPLNSKPLAIEISFELIEFLAASSVLHLQAEDMRQARMTLLKEYRNLLEISAASCHILPELRNAERLNAIAGAAASTRKTLTTDCAWPGQTTDTDNTAVRTAKAIYGNALGV